MQTHCEGAGCDRPSAVWYRQDCHFLNVHTAVSGHAGQGDSSSHPVSYQGTGTADPEGEAWDSIISSSAKTPESDL